MKYNKKVIHFRELLDYVSEQSELSEIVFKSLDHQQDSIVYKDRGLYWLDDEKELRTYVILDLIESNPLFEFKE